MGLVVNLACLVTFHPLMVGLLYCNIDSQFDDDTTRFEKLEKCLALLIETLVTSMNEALPTDRTHSEYASARQNGRLLIDYMRSIDESIGTNMVVLLRGCLAARNVLRGEDVVGGVVVVARGLFMSISSLLVREMMGKKGMKLGCMGIVRLSVGVV